LSNDRPGHIVITAKESAGHLSSKLQVGQIGNALLTDKGTDRCCTVNTRAAVGQHWLRRFVEDCQYPYYNESQALDATRDSNMKTVILASASPRRKELLEKIGLRFEVEPSNYEENMGLEVEPHELAKLLSLEKAKVVAPNHKDTLVIAADTFIVFEGKILGKPGTETEAKEMLETINGKPHSVITGFTIIDTDNNNALSRSVETKVYLRRLSSSEIDAYVKSKEPLDKAGAYAIQGLGSVIVEKIEGDYFNVIGLPLSDLAESLKEFGVHIL